MDADQIRDTLEQHLGKEAYRRFLRDFVRTARLKGRLLHWQEGALANAGLKLSFEECVPVFMRCHVHLTPLTRGTVRVHRDVLDVRYADEFERAMIDSFPYAPLERWGPTASPEVDFCVECAQQRDIYFERRA